ncbi:MAG: hypothetical protein JSW51_04955, partial [Gemmatimonadota bacterium]
MTSERTADQQRGVLATEIAGTPSSIPAVANVNTLEALEFAATLQAVAGFAVGELGADAVRQRQPTADIDWIRTELATVAEFQQLLDSGDPLVPEPLPDIRAVIERLGIPGDVLEPPELNAVLSALDAMYAVLQGLTRVTDEAPLLASLACEIPPKEVARAIGRALNPDGTVKDEASKELAKARRRLRETRSRLIGFLEKQQASFGGQKAEVTLKDGRYVIPVRRDDRDRITGIVHGESASGATLFVEPPEAVELGNELNAWEAEEARAVLAVLRDLTGKLRPHVDLLTAGLNMCVQLDDAYARARYAIAVDGVVPIVAVAAEDTATDDEAIADTVPCPPTPPNQSHQQWSSEPGGPRSDDDRQPLSVIRAQHPLLLAESKTAVPFDLTFS